jgi:hypothetical protein
MCETSESQNHPCDRTKIVFCGQEIEIFEQLDTNERLAPEIVKLKWRKEQILSKNLYSRIYVRRDTGGSVFVRRDTGGSAWNRASSHHNPKGLDLPARQSLESITSDQLDSHEDISKGKIYLSDFTSECVHAVWSGWLRWKLERVSAIFSSWQTWWCVLKVENTQLRLDCLDMDFSSGSMRKAKSVVLDPTCKVAFSKSMVACSPCAQLLIREQGSGHRHRLSCETPEEAERLLTCLSVLLKSVPVQAQNSGRDSKVVLSIVH